jgi:hypothetical protein
VRSVPFEREQHETLVHLIKSFPRRQERQIETPAFLGKPGGIHSFAMLLVLVLAAE